MNNCIGCGLRIQDKDNKLDGYSTNKDNVYCLRCYNLINRGLKYEVLNNNEVFNNNLEDKETLFCYITDIFSFNFNDEILKKLKGSNVILIINKYDLIQKNIKEKILLDYINENIKYDFCNVFLLSANKNYHIDKLYNYIQTQKYNKVYLIGKTNVGKSSIVNKLSKSIGKDSIILESMYSGTTRDNIETVLGKKKIIDTPGFIEENNFYDLLEKSSIQLLNIKKPIKPIVYQLNDNQTLFISSLIQLNYIKGERISFIFYGSNNLPIHRTKLENSEEFRKKHLFREFLVLPNEKEESKIKDFVKHKITLKANQEIVFDKIGWITTNSKNTIEVEIIIPKAMKYTIREKLLKGE